MLLHTQFFSFPSKHNDWVFHHHVARFWRCGNKRKDRNYITLLLQLVGRGQRRVVESNAANPDEGTQEKASSLASILSANSSCISHIATFSAKQKSPRCKWHSPQFGGWGRLRDNGVYHFTKHTKILALAVSIPLIDTAEVVLRQDQ